MTRMSRVVRLVASSSILLALTCTTVEAAPTLSSKRAEAAAARERLDDLAVDLEEKGEDQAQAEAAVRTADGLLAAAEARLVVAQEAQRSATTLLSRRARAIYRSGTYGFIDVVVGASSWSDALSRIGFMRRVAQSDAALVARVAYARADVEVAVASLENRRKEAGDHRSRARMARDASERALADQRAYLEELDAEVARLLRVEREREEREARERAARIAAALAETMNGAKPLTGDTRPEVVAVALQHLGVPYVWGGTTPSGFDCSGLTQYCFAKIGIAIPRTSRDQFAGSARVPKDRLDLLEPGDLVFFGTGGDPSRVHHVGIYIGDGDMVHAPQTGEVVRVESLMDRIARRADYVGGGRF